MLTKDLNLRSFIVVVLVNFAVQYLALHYLRVMEIAPDLTLLLILYLNISFPGIIGLLTAFALGLYQDIFFQTTIGSHSIVYLLAAYVAGRFLSERKEPGASVILLCSIYFSLFFSIVYQSLSAPAWGITMFWKPIIFSVYNSVWALPAFYLYRREFS